MTDSNPFWESKTLDEMTDEEWESLCDGCGKCCLRKIEEEDGSYSFTNVACRLLDVESGQCKHYENRKRFVTDCVKLRPDDAGMLKWLPVTCAYVALAAGEGLPPFHPLVTGDKDSVHKVGMSVCGRCISEDDAGFLDHHIVDWDDL